MGRGRGGGKTPEKLVMLLTEAVAKSSQASVAVATGLTRLTVQRYLKGIGEPSQATLEKLADYFEVSVAELRGGMPAFDLELAMQHSIKINEAGARLRGRIGPDKDLYEMLVSAQKLFGMLIDAAKTFNKAQADVSEAMSAGKDLAEDMLKTTEGRKIAKSLVESLAKDYSKNTTMRPKQ